MTFRLFNKPYIPVLLTGVAVVLSCTPALAQLDNNCTVSVLNRTSQVDANGNWTILNVPTGFGPMPILATCIRNGSTLVGQSTALALNPGQITGFDGTIMVGTSVPIPDSLAMTASPTTLTQARATSQLTVT